MKIKNKALRAGVWFKALSRLDRVLVDLTIKVTDNTRSSHLANSIIAITNKLEGLLESRILKKLRLIGHPLAEKISSIAQKWGNTSAKNGLLTCRLPFFGCYGWLKVTVK